MEIGEGIYVPLAAFVSENNNEKRCPVCGAIWVKDKPTLSEVRQAVKEVAQEHIDDIKSLGSESKYGYCGSVAKGVVGEHKPHAGMQPDIKGECGTRYDIDGFIISIFSKNVRSFKGKRWANRNRITRSIETKLRNSHKNKEALQYMRGGEKGFSIALYLPNQINKVISKGGLILIN